MHNVTGFGKTLGIYGFFFLKIEFDVRLHVCMYLSLVFTKSTESDGNAIAPADALPGHGA